MQPSRRTMLCKKMFGDQEKIFVNVHYWRAVIDRSAFASVHCLLMHKEGNEWPSQAEGERRLRGLHDPMSCSIQPRALRGPQAHKLVWIASQVRLNRPHFARTPLLRKQEHKPSAGLAELCPYANFKSVRQWCVRRTLPVRYYVGRASPYCFRQSANYFLVSTLRM